MDEQLRVPYYFPPQRYIPRLGGMGGGGGEQSPAGAGFHGLAQALELYMQLQQAKELKQEREKDKATHQGEVDKDRAERQADREEARRAREQQKEEGYAERGERRDLGEEQRLGAQGLTYGPGELARARQEGAKSTVPPPLTDITTPEGATAMAGAGLAATGQGERKLFERGTAALEKTTPGGGAVPFAGGFAQRPASEVSAFMRTTGTRSGQQDVHHDKWAHEKVRFVHDRVSEQERDNPGMGEDELRTAADAASRRYDIMFPEPGLAGPEKPKTPQSPIGAYLDAHPELIKSLVKP